MAHIGLAGRRLRLVAESVSRMSTATQNKAFDLRSGCRQVVISMSFQALIVKAWSPHRSEWRLDDGAHYRSTHRRA